MKMAELHEFDATRTRDTVISKGGQVSVPAEVRRRWGTDRVRLVDLGDRIVIRPTPADAIGAAKGSLRLPAGATAETLRAAGRDEDAASEQR